jgi:hypothetical protein
MEMFAMLVLIITLILTGYILYKVLRHPIKTVKLLGSLLCLAMVGCVVWFGIIYFAMSV